ncbi:MAG: hypothetical protein AAFX09_04175 [Pseudomonadota bacterium]
MDKFILISMAGLLLAACSTVNDDAAASAQPPTRMAENTDDAASELDPDAEVCRRVQRTGTRFHGRVCKTRAEWAQQAEEARRETRDIQRGVSAQECAYWGNC